MMPGVNQLNLKDAQLDDKAFAHVEAIIQSMTPEERQKPEILNGSRKKRIAAGSGRSIQEVNRMLKQFDEMKRMIKQFSGMTKRGKKGRINIPFLR